MQEIIGNRFTRTLFTWLNVFVHYVSKGSESIWQRLEHLRKFVPLDAYVLQPPKCVYVDFVRIRQIRQEGLCTSAFVYVYVKSFIVSKTRTCICLAFRQTTWQWLRFLLTLNTCLYTLTHNVRAISAHRHNTLHSSHSNSKVGWPFRHLLL